MNGSRTKRVGQWLSMLFLGASLSLSVAQARDVLEEVGEIALSRLPPPAQIITHIAGGLIRGGHERKRYDQISKRTEAEGSRAYDGLVREAEQRRTAGGSDLNYRRDLQRAQRVREAYIEEAKQIRRIGRAAQRQEQRAAEKRILGVVVSSEQAGRIFGEAKEKLDQARGAIAAARGDLKAAAEKLAGTGALGRVAQAAGEADRAAARIERVIAIANEVGMRVPKGLEEIARDLRGAERTLNGPGRLIEGLRERLDRVMEKADAEVARLGDEIDQVRERGMAVEGQVAQTRRTRPEKVSADPEIQRIREEREVALSDVEIEKERLARWQRIQEILERLRKKRAEAEEPKTTTTAGPEEPGTTPTTEPEEPGTTTTAEPEPPCDPDDPACFDIEEEQRRGGLPGGDAGDGDRATRVSEAGEEFQRSGESGGEGDGTGGSSGGAWGSGYSEDPAVTGQPSGEEPPDGRGPRGGRGRPPRGADAIATMGTSGGAGSGVFDDGNTGAPGSDQTPAGGGGGGAAASGTTGVAPSCKPPCHIRPGTTECHCPSADEPQAGGTASAGGTPATASGEGATATSGTGTVASAPQSPAPSPSPVPKEEYGIYKLKHGNALWVGPASGLVGRAAGDFRYGGMCRDPKQCPAEPTRLKGPFATQKQADAAFCADYKGGRYVLGVNWVYMSYGNFAAARVPRCAN